MTEKKEKKYRHVIEALNTYVWAIVPEWLDTIHEIVAARIDGRLSPEEIREKVGDGRESRIGAYTVDGTRVIPIHGVISKRMPMFADVSGGTSSEEIKREFTDALADSDVDAILLDIDSPGGTADGPGDLSDMIYTARGVKPVRAFANGMAASAAYYIGSAAPEFWTSQSAQVGSIGVITAHYDYSKAYENVGVKKTYLTAGKYKAIGNETEPLSKEGRDYIQGRLDFIYTAFVNAVARNRGTDAETVLKDMADGRIFIGEQAVSAGLADRVATFEEAVETPQVSGVGGQGLGSSGQSGLSGPVKIGDIRQHLKSSVMAAIKQTTEGTTMSLSKDDLQKEHPDLVKQIQEEAIDEAKDDMIGEGKALERERVVKILSAGGDPKVALECVKDGTRAESAFELFFRAEKEKNQGMLNDMEQEAPQSPGAAVPETPEKKDTRPPDEIVSEKAQELCRQQPGLTFEAAIDQVLAADTKLARAYNETVLK